MTSILASRSAGIARIGWAAFLVAALWLLSPALNPVHVEGFSASMVALGLHLAQNDIADFLPFAGLNADYFGLTKIGAVIGVAWLSPLLGGNGAMRVELWAGLIACLAASAWLVRRWSGAGWPAVAASLLLMPGLAESSFFFNDNIPSAGLMLAALAIWTWRVSALSAIAVGLLTGYAVAVRTDTLLVAVSAVPLIALQARPWRQAAALTMLAGAAAIALLFAVYAAVQASPLDSLRIGVETVQLWNRPGSLLRHLVIFGLFCGLAALPFLGLGLVALARRRNWREQALLAGVPLFANLVLLGKMWEIRQLLVLAPFLAALVAIGIQGALADRRAGRGTAPALLFAFAAAVLLSPPVGIVFSDGPRVMLGRFASIGLWRQWQASVRSDFARLGRVVDAAPAGAPLAVLTDGWNDDRYLHLVLVERGFRRIPLPAPCDRIAEAMRKGDRTIVQLSMMQTFLPAYPALRAPRLERYGRPCLAALQPARTILVADADRMAAFAASPGTRPPEPTGFVRIAARPLDAPGLDRLAAHYRAQAEAFGPAPDVDQAIGVTRSRTAFSR